MNKAQPKPRAQIHEDRSTGEHLADGVAAAIGSWRFIIIQSVLVVIWVAGNLYEALHFDPFPFILLNLMFSVQAAYTGPILLLASNRASAKDRLRDDRDDAEIGAILKLTHDLHKMQTDQMASHKKQTDMLGELVRRGA